MRAQFWRIWRIVLLRVCDPFDDMTVHVKEFPPKNGTHLGPNMLGQQHTHSLAGRQIRPDVEFWPRDPLAYSLHCGSCPKNPNPPSEKNRNVGVISNPFLRLWPGFLRLINRFLTTNPLITYINLWRHGELTRRFPVCSVVGWKIS